MDLDQWDLEGRKRLQEILGYLNYSSGTPDPRFLGNLNQCFRRIEQSAAQPSGRRDVARPDKPAWRVLFEVLCAGLDELRQTSPAFQQANQAEALLSLVFDEVLPAYRRFHADLLFHQTDESLFGPLFIGRVCEAVLAEGPPWQQTERIVQGALTRLNDFVGYRPVAVLQTEQKLQPYTHEWVRPIPLYVAGAGVAVGRYEPVVAKALEILRQTDRDLLRQAWFDPDLLEELSLDPRAYDFEHPANRRPNYHFGMWDPHRIDLSGRYRRFVLQQVTVDALLSRVEECQDGPREELLLEAAAVLAGTILMGSGISGSGPDTHGSNVTLAKLLPHIAAYRDAFYQRLIERIPEPHAGRLRREAAKLRQPFGGARQHLNQALARRRASQVQHVHLALLFARMGYTEAAKRQAERVPVASARLRVQIHCHLATGHLLADRGRLEEAAELLPSVEDLLHRAIQCGAMVDPWNILGFGGQFSLFPAIENSIHDHRVDELIEVIRGIFDLYARLEKQAAAAGQTALQQRLSAGLAALARWWDKFATTEVSGVESVSGQHMVDSADQVAEALGAWRQAGAAAGDIAFWRRHVQRFCSPKAFALLVEALLEQGDLIATMALLTYWLSRADEIRLAEGDHSFHGLAVRWMNQLWASAKSSSPSASRPPLPGPDRWTLSRKFLDCLEANSEQYWRVPQLELAHPPLSDQAPASTPQDDEAEDLYAAAYEGVTYRDSTDDGFEGEILDGGEQPTDFELTSEAERISERLVFLDTIARLWKHLAKAALVEGCDPAFREAMRLWMAQAVGNRDALLGLLESVHRYRVPSPQSTHASLTEFAQRQAVKELLLERVGAASVEMADAARLLWGVLGDEQPDGTWQEWERPAQETLQAAARGDAQAVRAGWSGLLDVLRRQPLLYIPTARGGSPLRVYASRSLQRVLHRLLAAAGRLGLLAEALRLLRTIQQMERAHPAGPGAFTEFDRLFQTGCQAIVQCVVSSSATWRPQGQKRPLQLPPSESELIELLEEVLKRLLTCWIDHSRNIRLSVLETVGTDGRWRQLKQFIERYGHDLFTQQFMNYGNLRAILHQGAEAYLYALAEEGPEEPIRLLDDLDRGIARPTAAALLELTLEAIVENYSEYIDYNSTTTQSDRGEMLYTLLDFLRVEASYDRVAWNLKPAVIAHEVLVRAGRFEAAAQWRALLRRRTASVADEHLERFEKLCKKYGMRLPSIADRLQERFVRPLDVDRLCAWVRPAVEQLRAGQPPSAFALLDKELAAFTEEPTGVGFEVPAWLEALEDELQRARGQSGDPNDPLDLLAHVPQALLDRQEIAHQLQQCET